MATSTRARHRKPPCTRVQRIVETDDEDDNEGDFCEQQLSLKKPFVRRKRSPRNDLDRCHSHVPSRQPVPPISATPGGSRAREPDYSSHIDAMIRSIRALGKPKSAQKGQRSINGNLCRRPESSTSRHMTGAARQRPLTKAHNLGMRKNSTKDRPAGKYALSVQPSPFLKLPPEIRNMIYELLMPKLRILVVSTHPNKELHNLNTTWDTMELKNKRPRLRLRHMLDNKQMDQGFSVTMDMLLACCQIRSEVELFLYSRTTFCFSSLKTINRFLNRASKTGVAAIEKIELFDQGYGNTKLTEDDIFQQRYYQKWQKTCALIAQLVTNLKHLKVEAFLQDWPCDLSGEAPNSAWKSAVLQLAPRNIENVELSLHHYMFHRNPWLLNEWKTKLENQMMNEEGRRRRDLAEAQVVLDQLAAEQDAKKLCKSADISPIAFKKAVIITINKLDSDTSRLREFKVRSTGLETFARLRAIGESFAH